MDIPKAKKINKKLTAHGEVRIDPYYWLNERENPEVIQYLEQENEYCDFVMKDTELLQRELFEEMKSRYKEEDESLPYFFNKYWYKNKNKAISFAAGREEELIYDIIMKESNNIADIEKLEIENKLILSMAIRLKGELYMQDKIMSVVPNGQSIVEDIFCKKNQSAWLIKAYKENINDERMNILEIVAMITPENIHLNSFMFEPILDMSLKYLYKIYNEIKLLS